MSTLARLVDYERQQIEYFLAAYGRKPGRVHRYYASADNTIYQGEDTDVSQIVLPVAIGVLQASGIAVAHPFRGNLEAPILCTCGVERFEVCQFPHEITLTCANCRAKRGIYVD